MARQVQFRKFAKFACECENSGTFDTHTSTLALCLFHPVIYFCVTKKDKTNLDYYTPQPNLS